MSTNNFEIYNHYGWLIWPRDVTFFIIFLLACQYPYKESFKYLKVNDNDSWYVSSWRVSKSWNLKAKQPLRMAYFVSGVESDLLLAQNNLQGRYRWQLVTSYLRKEYITSPSGIYHRHRVKSTPGRGKTNLSKYSASRKSRRYLHHNKLPKNVSFIAGDWRKSSGRYTRVAQPNIPIRERRGSGY